MCLLNAAAPVPARPPVSPSAPASVGGGSSRMRPSRRSGCTRAWGWLPAASLAREVGAAASDTRPGRRSTRLLRPGRRQQQATRMRPPSLSASGPAVAPSGTHSSSVMPSDQMSAAASYPPSAAPSTSGAIQQGVPTTVVRITLPQLTARLTAEPAVWRTTETPKSASMQLPSSPIRMLAALWWVRGQGGGRRSESGVGLGWAEAQAPMCQAARPFAQPPRPAARARTLTSRWMPPLRCMWSSPLSTSRAMVAITGSLKP
jgi:hypothetical protein